VKPAAIMLLFVIACSSGKSAPVPEPISDKGQGQRQAGDDEEVAQRADLETLCNRIESRQISAWSQPIYRSELVRRLTQAVDHNTAGARCELGLLMQELEVESCDGLSPDLIDGCGN